MDRIRFEQALTDLTVGVQKRKVKTKSKFNKAITAGMKTAAGFPPQNWGRISPPNTGNRMRVSARMAKPSILPATGKAQTGV